MRLRTTVGLLGLLMACGDSSAVMSALTDAGVGGSPASGGAVGYGGTTGRGGSLGYGGSGGSVGRGGAGGQAGGAGGVIAVPDAAPDLGKDSGPVIIKLDVAMLPDAAPIRPDGPTRVDTMGVDLARQDGVRIDVAAVDVPRGETAGIDGPLIRGFDAELAENLLPSAVTCCRRVVNLVDGGSLAFCDDLARGDAWRAYQYLLFLQQQGLLCTDLPY